MDTYPKRKRLRLKNFDYKQNGAYFATISILEKEYKKGYSLWEDNTNQKNPLLSKIGDIVEDGLNKIPLHYGNVNLPIYSIMPNHLHMIIEIYQSDKEGKDLSRIIGSFKRFVSKEMGHSIWQKSFHDRIIRDQKEYQNFWKYIEENPLKRYLKINKEI